MDADRKAEGRGRAFGYVVPTSAAIGRTPYTMVVLLVKHVACARRTHHVVDAVPDVAIAWRGRVVVVNACVGVREAVAASQVAPPSSVAKMPAAEIPTQSFFGLPGSDTMVCSTNPAAPEFQLLAEG